MNSFRRASRACWLAALGWAVSSPALVRAQEEQPPTPAAESTTELQERWEFFAPVSLPPAPGPDARRTLADVVLGPQVFAHARPDLADLRLYDAAGAIVPYALRVLRPESVRQSVNATEFNRAEPEDGPFELTLDLQQDDIQHNEVQIALTGTEFRRAATVEGSEDSKTWRELAAGNLLRFSDGEHEVEVDSLTYPDSRFRYVRVRIHADPNPAEPNRDPANEDNAKDAFTVSDVKVVRHVELPGERLTLDGVLDSREPVRARGTYGRVPGSAWIIDLGGANVPCDRIEVDVDDAEFARDISIDAELPGTLPGQFVFTEIALEASSQWQRRLGEAKKPLVAKFQEVQTGRLRLNVADYRNPPLTVRAVRYSAPVREVIFTRPAGEPRLYFGNPQADLTNYDFARNLPPQIEPPPARGALKESERNPSFVPPPQPFTERFPWLIYVVLGSVIVVLAAVILSLSRSAIALHDANRPDQPVAAGK